MLCSAFAAVGGGSAAEAEALNQQAASLLRTPWALQGDSDSLCRHYLHFAQQQPRSPLAELAVRLACRTPAALLSHPGLLAADMEGIYRLPDASPYLREAAAAYLAAVAARKQSADALDRWRQRGLVLTWHIIGPFGRYGPADFLRPHPPEQMSDLDREFKSEYGELRWRRVALPPLSDHIDPWEWIWPQRGVVYLLAQCRAPQAVAALIRLRSPNSCRLFLNRALLLDMDRWQQEWPREVLVEAALQPGANRLLIKLYPVGEEREIAVQLLAPDGRPLPVEWENGEEIGNSANGSPAAAPTAAWQPLPFLRDLRQAAASLPQAAWLQAALALACEEQGLRDEALEAARQACALEPRNAWFALIRAQAEASASQRGAARCESDAQLAYRQALALQPDCAAAWAELARLAYRRQRYREALEHSEKALAANPRCLLAWEMRLRAALALGWLRESLRWRDEMKALAPEAEITQAVGAAVATRWDRSAELAAALASLTPQQGDRPELALEGARAFLRCGEEEKARQRALALLEFFSGRPDVVLASSPLLAAAGATSEALAALRQILAVLPHHEAAWRRLGDMLLAANQREEAIAAYSRSLALRPGQHDLRRLLCHLKGESYAFWSPYALDALAEIRRTAGMQFSGHNVRVIDQTVLAIYADGSYANYTHEVQKVLTAGGVEEARSVPIYGQMLEVRTILPEGRGFLEPVRVPGRREFTMPAVQPGCAVEYKYLEEGETPSDRLLRFPKWYFRSPDSEEEFLLSQYVVRVPKQFPFVYAARNLGEEVAYRQIEEQDFLVHIWTGRRMPRPRHEPGAPHIDERLPHVAIASRRTWEDVNWELLSLEMPRCGLSRAICQQAERLCQGASAAEEKARRLHRFVLEKIEPRPAPTVAAQILDQGAGDRAVLLMALLRAAGVPARLGAVRPAAAVLCEPPWELPAAEHFPLRLVCAAIDGGYLWLDVRYRGLASGEILEDISGGRCLLIDRQGGELRLLPVPPPENFAKREARIVVLAAAGSGRVISGRCWRGSAGHRLKEEMWRETARGRYGRCEEHLTASLAAPTVSSLHLPGLTAAGPYREISIAASDILCRPRAEGGWATPLCLTPLRLLPKSDGDPLQRECDFHLADYLIAEDRVLLLLPPGAALKRLPRDLTLQDAFGQYTLRLKAQEGKIMLLRRYAYHPQRIALAAWPAYVRSARQIEEAEAQMVEWVLPAEQTP
ncbi:MAG: tetratricopeptide repeat protein [Planctomycetota bacterium]|nr:tetratricopeptide repeat protein [Planctomycetota bacterium]